MITLDQIATIALDPLTWDVAIPYRVLRGAPAVAQKIGVRFRFFLGEWFLDTRLGVPYFSEVLIKNPNPILISAVFRKVLSTTQGVQRVLDFQARVDPLTRTLYPTFRAVLLDGETLIDNSQVAPFIVAPS